MRVMSTCGCLILVIIALSVTLSIGDECTLEVYEKGSGKKIDGLCVEQFTSKVCSPFVTSFNISDLPPGFPLDASDLSVERPELNSLDLIPVLSPHKTDFYPGLEIRWNAPTSNSAKALLKGYLIIWEHETSMKCRLYKFDTSDRDRLIKELSFVSSIPFIAPNKYYSVRVYSMPPPENLEKSQREETFVSGQLRSGSKISNSEDPGVWEPSLSARVIDNGKIEVKVSHSPAVFKLTRFEVMLLKHSHNLQNPYQVKIYNAPPSSEQNSPMGVITFGNLESDQYKVVVHVIDPFASDDKKCLCWIKETNGRHCVNSCGSVGTKWFVLNASVPVAASTDNGITATTNNNTHATTSQSVPDVIDKGNGLDSTKIALVAVFSGVFALAVIVFIVWLLTRRWRKQAGFSTDSKSPIKPEVIHKPWGLKPSAPSLKRKTVYMVYTEDHPAHVQLVKRLVEFLQAHCQCHVVFPPWEDVQALGLLEWSRSAVDRADYILFVDSVAAKKFMTGFNVKQVYTVNKTSMSQVNQLFKLALDHIYVLPETREKVVLLYYREECGISQYLSSPVQLQLPKGFPDLLQRIHGLSCKEAEACRETLPLCMDIFPQIKGGSDLLSALQEVKAFEKESPDWFELTYGHLGPALQKQVSVISDESGIFTISGRTGMLSSCGAGSVSTQDLSSIEGGSREGGSQGSSPASVFDEAPIFPTEMARKQKIEPLQAAPGSRFEEPAHLPGRGPPGDDGESVFTVGENPLNGAGFMQKCNWQPPQDGARFFPPNLKLDLDNRSTFTGHLQFLNGGDGQSEYSAATTVTDSQVSCGEARRGARGGGNDGERYPAGEEKEESKSCFMASLQPPPSPTQVESFSTALQDINTDEEDEEGSCTTDLRDDYDTVWNGMEIGGFYPPRAVSA